MSEEKPTIEVGNGDVEGEPIKSEKQLKKEAEKAAKLVKLQEKLAKKPVPAAKEKVEVTYNFH